jgi:arylsulfatase A-like enzyme
MAEGIANAPVISFRYRSLEIKRYRILLMGQVSNGVFRGAIAWGILVGTPLFISRSPEFLGQDVSALALGIIGFYPWVGIFRLVFIASFTLLLTIFITFVFKIMFPKIGFWKHITLILTYFSGLFFFSLIKYPAFFSDFVPTVLDFYIWRSAEYINPDFILNILLVFPVAILGLKIFRLNWQLVVKRHYLFGLMLAVCSAGFFLKASNFYTDHGTQLDKRWNILIIGIDSLRYDAVSEELTPNIWTLKNDKNSVSFEDHIVGIPRTFPSWIEILTGQYASQTGVRHMFPPFNIREKSVHTMGDFFDKMGLTTFVVSDFAGDIFPRFRSGFDRVETPNLTITDIIKLNVTQQFRAFIPVFLALNRLSFFSIFRQNPSLADPKILTDIFMDQNLTEKPWMGLLFYSTAHFPYAAPYPFYRKFSETNYNGKFFFKKNPDVKITGNKIDSEEKRQVHALYSGSIFSIDQELGRLIRELKDNNTWENTLVIVTADHGEQLFDDDILQGHGEHLKGEWVLKVPLIVKIPENLPVKNHRVDQLSQSVDIFPTLLGILGQEIPPNMNGVDFSSYILGRSTKAPRDLAYSETGIWFSRTGEAHFQKKRLDYPGISGLLEFDVGRSDEIVLNKKFESTITLAKHRAIMNRRYKLIYQPTHEGVEYELFDRINDPSNQKNLVKDLPDVFKNLRSELKIHVLKYDQNTEILADYFIP